jgi:heat shock protein HspQ
MDAAARYKLTSAEPAINHPRPGRCCSRRAAAGSGYLLPQLLAVKPRIAKFAIGQLVRHRKYPFRGIIYDVDPVFAHTEEWWQSIPEEVRPHKDQPFYHLYAENAETEYVAYVSEQNLMVDTSGDQVRHPQVDEMLVRAGNGAYQVKPARLN